MPSKQHAQSTPRAPDGKFLPGTSGNPAGRPKGSRNAVAVDLKAAVLASLEQLGGAAYLIELGRTSPELYVRLLLQVLPKAAPELADDEEGPRVNDPHPDVW